MNGSLKQRLFGAARKGLAGELAQLLQKHPRVDINDGGMGGWTLLHTSAYYGHEQVVRLLLRHPRINVNQKDSSGFTPLKVACSFGISSVVRSLLEDPRVLVNEPDHEGFTPLQELLIEGGLRTLRWWIASGREMDLGQRAQECAAEGGKGEVIALLQRLLRNEEGTRWEIRRELGVLLPLVAGLFAVVVLLSDGYLRLARVDPAVARKRGRRWRLLTSCVRGAPEDDRGDRHHQQQQQVVVVPAVLTREERFFMITRRLPMELQQVVCHRVFGSMGTTVHSRDFNKALRATLHLF